MLFVHVYKIIQLQDLITQLMHKLYPVVGTCTQEHVSYPLVGTCIQDNSAAAHFVSCVLYTPTGIFSCCTCCILCFVHANRIIQLLHMLYPVLCTCTQDYTAAAHVVFCALYMHTVLFSCCTCCILCFVHEYRIIQLLHMLYPVLRTCKQDYSCAAHIVCCALYMHTGLFN